jgi:hypothetical protein
MTDYKALCARMADELDHYRQLLMDDRRETHALATEARAALAQPETEKAVNWAAYFARQAAAQEKEPLSPLSLIKSHKLISDATSRARQAAEEIEGRGEPTDEELIELSYEYWSKDNPWYYQDSSLKYARAVLARWGNL